ncbi:MAG: hypothetical protein DYH06_04695 [Acidobacteria bacterium ACB2]|nr:hypothetical protein [Acidobacteria bacterium ACB2]
MGFGRIEGLRVVCGEPVLDPAPHIARDFTLGGRTESSPTCSLPDFLLKEHVIQMFTIFDREQSITVEVLKVRNGLPVHMTVVGGLGIG